MWKLLNDLETVLLAFNLITDILAIKIYSKTINNNPYDVPIQSNCLTKQGPPILKCAIKFFIELTNYIAGDSQLQGKIIAKRLNNKKLFWKSATQDMTYTRTSGSTFDRNNYLFDNDCKSNIEWNHKRNHV